MFKAKKLHPATSEVIIGTFTSKRLTEKELQHQQNTK